MSDNVVFLQNVRLSFPHLADPQRQITPETGKERISYNADFILAQDNPSYQRFMQTVGNVATEKWKEHAQQVLQLIQNDRRLRCYGNGTEKINKKTFQPYDGYNGMLYITAGRDTMPQIIREDGSACDLNSMEAQQLARKMYGGCYVNAAVKPWPQDNKHGRAIRCDLVAVQFCRDGEPFGEGAVDVSGMFGAVQGGAQQAPAASAPQMPGMPSFLTGQ